MAEEPNGKARFMTTIRRASLIKMVILSVALGGIDFCSRAYAEDSSERLQQFLARFPKADADGNGVLTLQEAKAYRKERKTKASLDSNQLSRTTHRDVAYGSHERQRLDFWNAQSDHATPVLIFFHGGSFKAGDKSAVLARPIFKACLDAGISIVSANYRFSSDAPYPASMEDGARVVQFVRAQSGAWNIDQRHVAVSGSSAGATLALWIALHDELADASSEDPIAKKSSRVTCAAVHSGTAGLDGDYFRSHIGVQQQGKALWQLFGASSQTDFDSPERQRLAKDASPLTHLTRGDPPLFLTYQGDPSEAPFLAGAAQSDWIHHVALGMPLKAKCDEMGIKCELYYRSKPASNDAEINFLKRHLLSPSAAP